MMFMDEMEWEHELVKVLNKVQETKDTIKKKKIYPPKFRIHEKSWEVPSFVFLKNVLFQA